MRRLGFLTLAMLSACSEVESGLPPDITARMKYMEVVGEVAERICREPAGSTRDVHLANLQRAHQAFVIACDDDTVSVRLHDASERF